MAESSGQLEQLYHQVLEQKALDKIIEAATITEVEPEEKADESAEQAPKKKKSSKKKSTKKKSAKKDDA